MKIPKIIHRKNKIFQYLGKCNDNLYMYQDQFGIKESFSRFDLGRYR